MMTIDRLLDIIVPLDFGFASENRCIRLVIRLMMSLCVVAVIVNTAVSSTMNLCPEGVEGWYVWIMVAWRIFLHTIIYCLIVGVVWTLKGTRREKNAAPDKKGNAFFAISIDEEALVEYIRSNPDQFISGEDMAIFYLIMSENHYIAANKTKFHDFLSSLIDCKGCKQLSNGCMKVKEILDYHNLDEKKIRMVAKYEKMEQILQKFIIQ